MTHNLKEGDITYKARGSAFEFIKLVYLEEKETCSLKIQEVLFGDFKMFEVAKTEFENLISHLNDCRIPFPGYSNGKDGDHHHLEIQSGENAINLNWYGDTAGEQWKDVTAFCQKLVELKNKHLNS